MRRLNKSITSSYENTVLDCLVKKIPKFITPDILTFSALFSSVIGGLLYFFVDDFPIFFLVINLCLFFHWLFDGLDGRLARYRKKQRPNYGYYIDHILDSVTVFLLIGGLNTSGLTGTAIWAWVMGLMLLLMVHTFLKKQVSGVFELSIGFLGPTEARIALGLMNFVLFFVGNPKTYIFSTMFTLADFFGLLAFFCLLYTLFFGVAKTGIDLHKSDSKKYLR